MTVALKMGDMNSIALRYCSSSDLSSSLPSSCSLPLPSHLATRADCLRASHPDPTSRSEKSPPPLSRRGKTRERNQLIPALATGWQVPTKSIAPLSREEWGGKEEVREGREEKGTIRT